MKVILLTLMILYLTLRKKLVNIKYTILFMQHASLLFFPYYFIFYLRRGRRVKVIDENFRSIVHELCFSRLELKINPFFAMQ